MCKHKLVLNVQVRLYVLCICIPAERISERAERTLVTLPIILRSCLIDVQIIQHSS